MALLFVDSFPYDKTFADIRYTSVIDTTSSFAINTTDGRFGGRWAYFYITGYWDGEHHYTQLYKNVGGSAATVMLQFGYKPITYSGAIPIVQLRDLTTNQIYMTDTGGTLKVYNGDNTLLGTSDLTLSANVWHQVEIKVLIHASAGTVLVKVDGIEYLNLTGIDTLNSANAKVTGFAFGWGNDSYTEFGISDVIFMDTTGSYCNDLLGSRMVELKVPTGAGTYSDFTPSAGSNYQNVDDVPPDDDTTYNTGNYDEVDTFTKANLANASATVDAVVCSIYCKANDGGEASVRAVAYSGGDTGLGTEQSVPSSYDWLQSIIYVDPHTAAPFTAAGFDAAEIGYKRTA